MINDEVKPPHHSWLEPGQMVWEDPLLHIPRIVIPVEADMVEEGVWQGLSEPEWSPYRNAHFLVRKKNEKYRFIISTVSVNWHPLEDAWI